MISLKTESRQVSGEMGKLSTHFQCSRFWVGINYDAFRIQIRILIDGHLLNFRYISMNVIWKEAHGPIAAR
jgi:hypothetical protein